jgi:hypothetical protein
MKIKFLPVAAFVLASLPLAAYAQGTVRGTEEGAAVGERAAGPLSAIVGGTVGAAAGTVGGILGPRRGARRHAAAGRRNALCGASRVSWGGRVTDMRS